MLFRIMDVIRMSCGIISRRFSVHHHPDSYVVSQYLMKSGILAKPVIAAVLGGFDNYFHFQRSGN